MRKINNPTDATKEQASKAMNQGSSKGDTLLAGGRKHVSILTEDGLGLAGMATGKEAVKSTAKEDSLRGP